MVDVFTYFTAETILDYYCAAQTGGDFSRIMNLTRKDLLGLGAIFGRAADVKGDEVNEVNEVAFRAAFRLTDDEVRFLITLEPKVLATADAA